MLFDAIQVNFTNLSGLGRRPIAHTCNTVLELSSTYQSFPELREELSAILASDYWEMDIVWYALWQKEDHYDGKLIELIIHFCSEIVFSTLDGYLRF